MRLLLRYTIPIALLFLAASSLGIAQSTISVDGGCSLDDAIRSANDDRGRGGCRAGYGADFIELTRDVTLRSAMPAIRSDITIYGNWHSISGNNRYQIFHVQRGASLTLESVTLVDGRGVDDGDLSAGSYKMGGAIRNDGRLRVNDAVFRDNYADDVGGAILNTAELTVTRSVFEENHARIAGAVDNWDPDALISISDSEFRGNSAMQYGGAIDNGGSLTIQASAFYDNSGGTGGAISNWTGLGVSDSLFVGNSARYGGAIRSNRAEATMNVNNSEFSDNSARRGGAIDIMEGYGEIHNSAFMNNSAEDAQGDNASDSNHGGAIHNGGEVHIRSSVFNGNYADDFGGAVNNRGQAAVSDSAFNNNRAQNAGGGMANIGGEATVSGSAFIYNFADRVGGGIYMEDSAILTVERSSLFENDASNGGGIQIADGQLYLRSSMLGNNYPNDCDIEYGRGSLNESRDNHIADGSCNPRWSGPAYDGYCPPNQYRNGSCRIGAPPLQAQPMTTQPIRTVATPEPPTPEPPPRSPAYDGIVVDSYCSLSDAIRSANNDYSYGGCPAGYGADTINLAEDVTLRSELPRIESDITIHGNGHSISGDGRYRIFTIESNGELTIANITLTRGYAADDGELNLIGDGGAILNLGVLDASDCEFRGNRAGEDGGAIRNVGTASFIYCRFLDNRADRQTGAVYSSGTTSSGPDSSSLRVQSGRFSGNRSARHGGAIFVGGDADISYSAFSDNAAGISGGAIYSIGRTQIHASEFRANQSQNNGGAIFNDYEAHISVRDSEFADNRAVDGGGALFTYGRASANIADSHFYGNAARDGGGVMAKGFARGGTAYYADLSLRGNNFSDNRGGDCFLGEYGELRQDQGNSFADGGCWR